MDRKRKYGRARAKEQRPGREQRLRSPKRFEMPWRIRRSAIRAESLAQDTWWWIEHRRGLRRPQVGMDPLEARAVSLETVYGSLPERIVYKRLTEVRVYFTFQSSLQGGRMELGGIVADFILPDHMFIIQVQGPTHQGPWRLRKDEEQRLALEDMGYTVFYVEDTVIYDEYAFEDWIRRLFGFGGVGAGNAGQTTPKMDTVQAPAEEQVGTVEIWQDLVAIGDIFEKWLQ